MSAPPWTSKGTVLLRTGRLAGKLAAGKVSGDKSSMKSFTTTPRIDSPNSLLGLGLGRRLATVNWIKMFYLIASDSKRSI